MEKPGSSQLVSEPWFDLRTKPLGVVVADRNIPCLFGYITDPAYLVQWLIYSASYSVTYSISIT